MKRTFLIKAVSHLGFGAALVAAPFAFTMQSLAQDAVTTETADEVINGTQTSDPFSSENGASDLLQLMQQLNRGQNWGDFLDGQQENVDSAISDFWAERERLMNNQTETPAEKQAEGEELQSASPLPVYRALW